MFLCVSDNAWMGSENPSYVPKSGTCKIVFDTIRQSSLVVKNSEIAHYKLNKEDLMTENPDLRNALKNHVKLAFSFNEIIRDDSGAICDFRIIDLNAFFSDLMMLSEAEILGSLASEISPHTVEPDSVWLKSVIKIFEDKGDCSIRHFSLRQEKWYDVQHIWVDEYHFSTLFYDITEPVAKQQELSDNKEKFRRLLENSNDWISVLNSELRFTFSTKIAERILGISRSEIFSHCIRDFVSKDDLARFDEIIDRLRRDPDQVQVAELRFTNKSGLEIWLELIMRNMLDLPSIKGFIINAREIGDRKAAEEALRESESMLRYITDNANDVIFMTDKELNTTYISPSVRRQLKVDPQEYIHRKLEQKFTPESIAKIQRILAQEMIKDADPTVNKNRSIIVELQHYGEDDKLIDLAIHVSFIRDDFGQFNGLLGISRDVTAQKQAEREIEEKNRYIESLLEAIPDLIFVLDRDAQITDFKAAEDIALYVDKDNILGSNIRDLLPEDLVSSYLEESSKLHLGQRSRTIQYQLQILDSIRSFEARLSTFGQEHIIALVRDTTDQHNANLSIRYQSRFQKMISEISSAFVKATVDNIDEIITECLARVGSFFEIHRAYIYRYSEDYSVMYCSNEWSANRFVRSNLDLKRYPSSNTPWWHQEILQGKLIRIEDKEDLPEEAAAERNIMQLYEIDSLLFVPIMSSSRILGYFGFDSIGKTRHFSSVEVDNLKVIANLLGEVLHKFDAQADLDRFSSLQKVVLHMAMSYINLPAEALDGTTPVYLSELGEFTKADRAFIFDYDWEKKTCSNTTEWCAKGVAPQKDKLQDIPHEAMMDWVDLHRAGKPAVVSDIRHLPVNDGIREILMPQDIKSTITAPLIKDGECLGFVGLDYVKDIRKESDAELSLLQLFAQLLVNVRKRSELELRLIHEKERAEEASKAKSQFLANMSHEIRTPLNGVAGFTDLLINSGLNSVQMQYAHNILNSSKNLLGIITDILDFSKIEAGKLDLDLTKTDIVELMEQTADIVKVKADRKNLDLCLNIPTKIPRRAMLDPLRLSQILINLLSNAIKFTHKGEVELVLDYTLQEDNMVRFFIAIRDTGIGISEDDQHKLFRAFSQVDASTTRLYGGTGLGLVIANKLAELMDSKIQIKSEEGKGSVFSFSIDCELVPEKREPYPSLKKIKKVMQIGGHQRCREILKMKLQEWDLSSDAFSDPATALDLLEKGFEYDLIIVNHKMKGFDGLKALEMIRKHLAAPQSQIPILLLHDSTIAPESLDKCLIYDNVRHMEKPVKNDNLYEYLLGLDNPELFMIETQEEVENDSLDRLFFEHRPKILVAEDNTLNLTLIMEMISRMVPQAQIISARNGFDAIEESAMFSPDIILMDVQMPQMDGIAACQEIRKKSNVPIIAVTAGAFAEEEKRCLDAGMNGFLTKPVQATELHKTLKIFLPPKSAESKEEEIIKQSEASESRMAHFDKALLLRNLSGDATIMHSLLEIAIESIPQKITQIREAYKIEDITQTKSLLHALRGSSQNMRFDQIGQLAGKLESTIDEISRDQADSIISELEAEWKIVNKIISEDL